jgi:hypothetical protein
MLEEPVDDRVAPPESIEEEEPMPREDQDEPESEEEQKSSVLFTQEQLEIFLKMGRPDFCRNPNLAKCGGEAQHLKRVEDLESSGTPECSELNGKGQNTLHWGVLGIIGKVLKHVDIENDLALVIWTSAAQVIGKRRAGSQTGNLTPDH